MEYQVPQFIEVEDKIFGPLTFRQFAYLAGAGGICLIWFTLLPMWLAIPLSLPFAALGLGLAFYRVNGRPFISALEHAVSYYLGSKLYLWKQREPKPSDNAPTAQQGMNINPTALIPTMSEGKLRDLAWSLNIKDRQHMGVTSQNPSGFEV